MAATADHAPALLVYEARLVLLESLGPIVDRHMRKHRGPTWLDHLRNLRDPTAAPSSLDEATTVTDLDDQALLKVMFWQWDQVFSKCGIGKNGRGLVSQALASRNESAHPTAAKMSREEASSHLASFINLIRALGDNERRVRLETIRSRLGRVDNASAESKEAGDRLVQLESRILEQMANEFRARAEASREVGIKLAQELAATKSNADRITEDIADIKRMLQTMQTQPPPARPAPAVTVRAPPIALRWAVRKNPGGTYSAWGQLPNGSPKYRLCFDRAVMTQLIGENLVESAERRKGGWLPVVNGRIVEALVQEARTRLGSGNPIPTARQA